MNKTKKKKYLDLVSLRKNCYLCRELTNPSSCGQGLYDSNEIGPWSIWQNNLDADIMIVGQDWGDTEYFLKNMGKDSDNNPTNKTIKKLIESIGPDIGNPSNAGTFPSVYFLTNAILCLKKGGMGAEVKNEWFSNCGEKFLKPLINIIKPKIIITLGKYSYVTTKKLFQMQNIRYYDAVRCKEGFLLDNRYYYFPMYHCSPRVLHTHREIQDQISDWKRIKEIETHDSH